MKTSYVEEAHNVIKSLQRNRRGNIELTTSQLRKFLLGLISIHNKIQGLPVLGELEDDRLSQEIIDEIQVLKVRLVYQCGRERAVRDFERKAGLISKIDNIKASRKAFEDFFTYVEALVAYHKFEGGRD